MPIRNCPEISLPLPRRYSSGRVFVLAVVRGPTADESSLTDAERSELLPINTQAPSRTGPSLPGPIMNASGSSSACVATCSSFSLLTRPVALPGPQQSIT